MIEMVKPNLSKYEVLEVNVLALHRIEVYYTFTHSKSGSIVIAKLLIDPKVSIDGRR